MTTRATRPLPLPTDSGGVVMMPTVVYEALFAIARAVAHAHEARADNPKAVCAICDALKVLDEVGPKWGYGQWRQFSAASSQGEKREQQIVS